MRDYRDTAELLERIVHKYNQTESKKMCYGTDTKLTRKEIHTINAVGNNAGINVTTLAKMQGITKGAVSQMVYKLVEKGYMVKSVSPDSDAEVRLELTELGMVAYDAHNEYHKQAQEEFFMLLKDMPDNTYNQMKNIMQVFEDMLDRKLNKE